MKKGDTVQIITGKDKGKKGKLLRVFPSAQTVIVEGMNMKKKHKRARSKTDTGGIVDQEHPIHISNVKKV